ncbi:MAG TPA: 50S ribosomal protein L24 [Solirubrobacteraceae bacterium]|jgi:large subunit ribosomal protein L24|nr:50S ribosomal protein L24 [Solirubrobacteraceae bacterium]
MSKRKAATPPKRRSLKIRSEDRVQVISGKDRGKTGRVLRVEPAKERVYVEHLNMIKRHTRPQQVAGAQSEQQLGGVIEREGPIHISNVMLLDAKGKPTRVGVERTGGERVRVAKSSGARLD